tara:strand:+ start:1645 stop:2106 length:462 start_codon:yes stop_codon:yes gene_type:complete
MNKKVGGFVAGTRLLCSDGMIPVEFIGIGERVISRDAGMVRVTEINRTVVETNFIKLKPHALDEASPVAELLLPHDQMVLVRNWRAREIFAAERALVAAKSLVDDIFVEMTGKRKEVLFQISFSSPHILYAEGAEVGSADSVRARGKVLHPAE